MINRQTRIDLNKNSFTIIDNLFTNLYCAKFSGIIISDLSDHFPIILSLDINKSNRLKIVNIYNTKHNLINDVTVYNISNFLKLSTGFFLKLIIQKLHVIYLLILLFINLIFIAPYMKIENIKKICIPWNTKEI